MDIPIISYLNELGVLDPSFPGNIPSQTLLKGYEAMWMTRLMDAKMITLQRQGMISFAISSLGEEACAVASAAALSLDDWMYPQYRESGVMFWRGLTPLQYVHHMFGNAEDPIKGRQMPNHFGLKTLNVVTVSSPIGTKIPHTAGCAYAMKLLKEKAIAICYFGEGATSEGDFHAGLNFAAVRKAPALFFCRNNGYAISTASNKQYACDDIASKGLGYGMPAYRVDGNDFFAIYEVVQKAKKDCLENKGPALIEAITYRRGAHSTSDDPTRYRKEEESKAWEKKDPLLRLKLYLIRESLWDEGKDALLESTLKEQIEAATETAKQTPRPAVETIVEDVYEQIPWNLQEELKELKKWLK